MRDKNLKLEDLKGGIPHCKYSCVVNSGRLRQYHSEFTRHPRPQVIFWVRRTTIVQWSSVKLQDCN
jgi:hypothetical protein